MDFWNIIKQIIIIIYFVSIIYVAVSTVMENRNPVKTISWVLVLVLLPIVGFICYMFFGQNLRKEKIIARKGLKNHDLFYSIAHEQVSHLSETDMLLNSKFEEKRRLVTLLLNNSNAVVSANNSVDVLQNGRCTFDAIIAAIEVAKVYIHLQYYIFADDATGRSILNILKRKATEGVEVRMIVDDVGSWELKRPFFREMWNAGIQIYSFLPVHFPKLTSKINYRNHRKIVVVDGITGFLGGLNIADRYARGTKQFSTWRDTHLRVKGDAVNSLQTIFSIDWYFVSREELNDKKYFPHKKASGSRVMQIVPSGPDSDWAAIMMGIFHAISCAKRSVLIASPYFMPTEAVLLAIKTAALSGIDVKTILPQRSDSSLTLLSSRSYLRELMEAGVQFYFYQKGFIHCKTLVIDDFVSIVGSANMDFRSFEQNYEITAFIYDEKIAAELTATFYDDLSHCAPVLLDDWNNRPLKEKAKESFARVVSPLM
ncbi:MAG: cardiolipin synthase [Cytophagaceae bacterium]|jgi:cardiolipin synthase|nr:cardiolipin synthase [Cytophagaceae bacterium]